MGHRIRGRQQLVIEGAGDSWSLKKGATPYIAFTGSERKCKGLVDNAIRILQYTKYFLRSDPDKRTYCLKLARMGIMALGVGLHRHRPG